MRHAPPDLTSSVYEARPREANERRRPAVNLALLVWRQALRNLWRRPLAATLNTVSVAVGVGVFVAVQTANHSVARSFEAGVEMLAGNADLEVTGLAGRFDESCYPKILASAKVSAATPMLRAVAALPESSGEFLEVIGIDPFTNSPFLGSLLEADDGGRPFDFESWLGRGGIALSPQAAKRLGAVAGDEIAVLIDGVRTILPVLAIWAPADAVGGRFAWMDIAWVQERFGARGKLSSILIKLNAGADAGEVALQLREALPQDVAVARPARRGEQVLKMTSGFRLNLQAMSGVSLLVGAFLVYGTVSASVVRRRTEIGILRAQGLGRGGVRLLFLAEALALGGLGIPAGLALGVLLGNGLLGAVSATVTSLYVASSIEAFFIPWDWMIVGALAGVGAVVAGAWFPAAEAARVEPVEALQVGRLRERACDWPMRALPWAAVGAALAILTSWLALETGPPWLGFVSAFFVLASGSLLMPSTLSVLSVPCAQVGALTGLLSLRIAAVGVGRSLHRVAVSGAALAAAVALATGVAVMIHSFRESMRAWADQVIAADIFVGLDANEAAGAGALLPHGVPERLANFTGVAAAETYRKIEIELGGLPMDLVVVDGEDRGRFRFIGGSGHFAKWVAGRALILSESGAMRLGKRDGDVIELPTPRGQISFEIAGVFRDYTSDKGVAMMRREEFEELWGERRAQSVAIYLEPGGDRAARAEALADEIRAAGLAEGLSVFTNAGLRSRVSEIFEQTFAVTKSLRYVAMSVALIGVLLSLATLVVERGRELAILRAQGMSQRGIATTVLWEAQILALASSFVGLLSGLGLAVVLTGVINKAFFGWTIDWRVPWDLLLTTPLWIALSAAVAALLPAFQASRANLTRALREE